MSTLRDLTDRAIAFRDARDWRRFHTPKNLVMALASEAGELCDLFRWLPEREQISDELRIDAGKEVADVMIFALMFCHALNLDPAAAIRAKLKDAETRYPVETSRGVATKWTRL
jgi:NTP pyrophosphatase (non-canonical NTP hydrolase)